MPFMEDPIFERSLTYEPSFQLDGQAHHLGSFPGTERHLHRGRNGYRCD